MDNCIIKLLVEAQSFDAPVRAETHCNPESFTLVQSRNERVSLFVRKAEELGVDSFTAESIVSQYFNKCEAALTDALVALQKSTKPTSVH